jgi:predicted amidohydrolase
LKLAEPVPGPSTDRLKKIAERYEMAVFAGLIEVDSDGRLYNTYVGVDADGILVSFRKLHPFISKFLSAGESYQVFEYRGWKFGILICYDNNIIENVRATTLMGAEVILAPHVTGCTPSTMPGRGFIDDELWQNRIVDPIPLRMEFDGPKGREWLMRWLPARAYDNGVYYVFANPIGYDGSQLKNGNSLILDPYGGLLSEIKSFDDEVCTAVLTKDKLTKAGGYRYRNARRPELYRDILGRSHESSTKPVWLDSENRSD